MLDHVLGGILTFSLPKDATISIILSKPADCSKPVRAPAFDRRGVPKVVALHTVQLGKDRPVLRWQAQEAKPLPVEQQSKVVRVACIKQFVMENVRRERSRNFSGAAKSWLATLRIPKEDIVNIFAPRKSECGTILSVNVRVVAARAAEIEMASGIAGFLSRELPSDSKAIQRAGTSNGAGRRRTKPALRCSNVFGARQSSLPHVWGWHTRIQARSVCEQRMVDVRRHGKLRVSRKPRLSRS